MGRGTSAFAVLLFLGGALLILIGARGTYRDVAAALTAPLHPATKTPQQTGATK
jgi:hypothetical protein